MVRLLLEHFSHKSLDFGSTRYQKTSRDGRGVKRLPCSKVLSPKPSAQDVILLKSIIIWLVTTRAPPQLLLRLMLSTTQLRPAPKLEATHLIHIDFSCFITFTSWGVLYPPDKAQLDTFCC